MTCDGSGKITNRQAHEDAAGMGLDVGFFVFNGINPHGEEDCPGCPKCKPCPECGRAWRSATSTGSTGANDM